MSQKSGTRCTVVWYDNRQSQVAEGIYCLGLVTIFTTYERVVSSSVSYFLFASSPIHRTGIVVPLSKSFEGWMRLYTQETWDTLA